MIFLLLIIFAANAMGSSCDCLGLAPSPAGLSRPANDTDDACGDGCVPDCFCCSAILPAASAVFVPAPAPVSGGPELPVYELSSGIFPIPDHVPIYLS
jgi:hypothetical protein